MMSGCGFFFESDEIEIYDYIVDESGHIISDYDVDPITIIPLEGGKADFILEKDDYLERYDEYKVEGLRGFFTYLFVFLFQ